MSHNKIIKDNLYIFFIINTNRINISVCIINKYTKPSAVTCQAIVNFPRGAAIEDF